MRRDGWLDQFDPARLEPLEGSRLIQLHQSAVAGQIGGEDGGELAFHERGHAARLMPKSTGTFTHGRFEGASVAERE